MVKTKVLIKIIILVEIVKTVTEGAGSVTSWLSAHDLVSVGVETGVAGPDPGTNVTDHGATMRGDGHPGCVEVGDTGGHDHGRGGGDAGVQREVQSWYPPSW